MSQQMLEASHRALSLDQVIVADAMHPGVVTCPLETPLPTVARMMALYRIHCVVVFGEEQDDVAGTDLWGVVSDLDLVRAATAGGLDDRSAGGTAVTPVVLVEAGDTLAHAAQLMSEHEVAHLVVVDTESSRPIGILSSLDLARVVGGVV
jgi:CBS domain-containing protein